MAKNNSYVLAMYDVRGKQNFIYSGKKIKEIIGASHVIKDVFNDYLYDAAKEYCENEHIIITSNNKEPIYNYQNVSRDENDEIKEFTVSKFREHMEEGESEDNFQRRNYIGEVVYEGGGNFFVLYCNAETCEGVNRIFTAKLLKEIGTLKVLCTYKSDLDFSDFEGDRKALYAAHRLNEAQESVIYPVNTLPFVQTAPDSNRPYTDMIVKVAGEEKEKVTTEQKAKYEKYFEWIDDVNGDAAQGKNKYDKEEFLLDKLVEERGTESLLAVIYIDGNNMGAKVQACLEGKSSYDECVNELRRFSEKIQKSRVDYRTRAINNRLEEKYDGNINKKVRRTIVAAGDEMTIICNVRDALDVVQAYFQGLPEGESACAGIAIFHSHSPYADAYRIAEECCESCKSYMKDVGVTDLNLMDFHYCQGGIGISLDKIREREFGSRFPDKRLLSRPWKIDAGMVLSPAFNDSDRVKHSESWDNSDYGLVNRFAKELNKTARGNVKSLLTASQKSSIADLEMELKRINAHSQSGNQMDFSMHGNALDLEKELDEILKSGKVDKMSERKKERDKRQQDNQKDLIYDISTVFDLWFAKKGEK